MDRRRFLQFTGALAGAAAFCQVRGDLAHAAPPLRDYPFTLGVASGDPSPNRAVLWTRLAPEPLEPGGGMPQRWVPVTWRVAKDPGMRRVVRAGITRAVPELAHSVHVEVGGLEPRRECYFQFRYHGEESPVLRADDRREPAHQILRRRPARLRALQGRPRRVAHRPANGHDGEPQRCAGLHLRVIRGGEREAGGGSGRDDVLHQQLVPLTA
jgi:phosphodiesterase/alkaline phosphatase D-like protein